MNGEPEDTADDKRKRRSAIDWLDEYSQYHQNHTNELIHWICVPSIMFSLLGLLWAVPMPDVFTIQSPWFNPAMLFCVVAILFYSRLSFSLAIGMTVVAALMLLGIFQLEKMDPSLVWQTSVVVFVVAWIGQFIGHRIEGRKPAFFKDLQFLLIGPIWLLGFIYRKIGIPIAK